MWTVMICAQHGRDGSGFYIDLMDLDWADLKPLLPPTGRLGRPPDALMSEIGSAIFYVLRGGVPWRMVPQSSSPQQTTYGWFGAWRAAGVCESLNHPIVLDGERTGHESTKSAAALDSQSVKTAEARELGCWDVGKKVLGRKRHAMVDTDGQPLETQVGVASVQDREGPSLLLKASRRRLPLLGIILRKLGLRSRARMRRALDRHQDRLEDLRSGRLQGPSRCWPSERCLAWLVRNRRLAKDFDATIPSATAFLNAASAMLQNEFRVRLSDSSKLFTHYFYVPVSVGSVRLFRQHYVALPAFDAWFIVQRDTR